MSLNVNEPFLRVLTSAYNGEKYLRDCIESVMEQKYENWDYVLVNNCSTDNSLIKSVLYCPFHNLLNLDKSPLTE